MASTFSDLKIELIGTGEQVGTWGSTTNANLGTAIEEATRQAIRAKYAALQTQMDAAQTPEQLKSLMPQV
jgi:hypothetical protein